MQVLDQYSSAKEWLGFYNTENMHFIIGKGKVNIPVLLKFIVHMLHVEQLPAKSCF